MSTFIILILSLGVITVIYLTSKADKKKRTEDANQIKAQTDRYVEELQQAGERFEREGIPEVTSDVSLRKTEKLHVVLKDSQWMEYRKVRTGRVSGHAITGRVKIAKGLYYRYGTSQYKSESFDHLTTIDSGDFYVTSKGLVFRGSKGNKTLPFEKVMELVPFEDGMRIERETGKDIYIPFKFSSSPDKAAAIVLLWDKCRNV